MKIPNSFVTTKKIICVGTLLATMTVCSCTNQVHESLRRIDVSPQTVEVPEGYYTFATWVEDNTIVLTYLPTLLQGFPDRLLAVDLKTGASYEGPDWKNDKCKSGYMLRLRRLHGRQVAVLVECFQSELGQLSDSQIYVWDLATKSLSLLQRYSDEIGIGDFAFAPDLSVGLQEGDGDGLSNRLYTVTVDGPVTQVFTDVFRAGAPDWSLDGKHIAYALTLQPPKEHSSIFTGLVAIDNALNQPWAIYTANPDFTQQIAVADGAAIVRKVRFSPDGQLVAFNSSNYRGNRGIFIAVLKTQEVVKVWNDPVSFDWSPSGKQMLLMVDDQTASRDIFFKPVILNLADIY